jgi:spore maturation protein CgeB
VRVVVVHPGPNFSVADVLTGWVRGLRSAGCEVAEFNLDARLNFFAAAHMRNDNGTYIKALPDEAIRDFAIDGVYGELFKGWPDVVLTVSGFYVPPAASELIRARGMRSAVLFTESPYEDDRQLERAEAYDLVLVNDPTHLERFRAVNPNSHFQWHCYDPDKHQPGPVRADCRSDFCFVGTGYPSRVEFFEQVDWTGIDATFAGHWGLLTDDSPLRSLMAHPIGACCDNTETVELYRGAKASANVYRREADAGTHHGWAAGPREVELAACETFFLRESRGEGDELFPRLPTFSGPEEFGDLLRWWLAHDTERVSAARSARAAVSERTFESSARRLLRLLDT